MSLGTQIKRAMLPREARLVTIPLGLYRGLRLKIDFHTQLQFYLGLSEAETNHAIRSVLNRAKWMIDIGAGHGELSILFKRFGAEVVAVEPGSWACQIYENLKANNISTDEITIIETCIDDNHENGHIKLDDIKVNHSLFGFIKIDVDGDELTVLRSGTTLLINARPSLLVETHSIELERGCISFLKEIQYRCEVIENAWWRTLIPEMRPIPHNRWIFCTRDVID